MSDLSVRVLKESSMTASSVSDVVKKRTSSSLIRMLGMFDFC